MTFDEILQIFELTVWPLAFVLIIIFFFFIFRKPLGEKIKGLISVGTSKGNLDFSQNQDSPTKGSGNFDPLKDHTENYDPLIKKRAGVLEKDVKALVSRSEVDSETLLIHELAASNFREEYILIYSQIFGTQLDALVAAEKGPIELKPFYSQHVELTKEETSYKPSEQNWRYFLNRHALIEEKEEKVILTENGQLFLKYVRGKGLSLNKVA